MALFDSATGGDLGLASAEAQPLVPEANNDTFKLLTEDLARIKKQKERPTGGVVGQSLINLCFLHDEQYVNYKNKTLSLEAEEANKLRLSFNLIAPRFYKLLGRLSAFNA